MSQTYRMGALLVVENARPQAELAKELRGIDDRLFLERQLTLAGEEVWCVVCDLGDQPPQTILEWRDERGRPLHELSSGIIHRIQSMDRGSGQLVASVMKANADRIETIRKDTHAKWAEVGSDADRLLSPIHSAVLPRGVSLRRHRDKMRAQGRRV